MLDGRVARLSEHRHPVRRGARLAGGRDLLRRGPGAADLLPRFRQRGPVRLDPVLHLRHGGRAPAGPVQRARRPASRPPAGSPGMPSPSAGMTLAVYYPFSQTDWYRASLAYLDLQHQGLVVLMLLLARADGEQRQVPQVPADRAPQRARDSSGWRCISAFCSAGSSHPSIFCFRSGSFYMAFGLVAGHGARPDGAAGAGADRGRAAGGRARPHVAAAPLPRTARRAGATAARSQRTDELPGTRAGHAAGRAARSAGPGGGARARRARLRRGRRACGSAGRSSWTWPPAPATRPRRAPGRCATSCWPTRSPRTTCSRWRSA